MEVIIKEHTYRWSIADKSNQANQPKINQRVWQRPQNRANVHQNDPNSYKFFIEMCFITAAASKVRICGALPEFRGECVRFCLITCRILSVSFICVGLSSSFTYIFCFCLYSRIYLSSFKLHTRIALRCEQDLRFWFLCSRESKKKSRWFQWRRTNRSVNRCG